MYHIVAVFDVTPGRHQEFIAAALEDGRDSRANEPGTKRFELIEDERTANRFWLNEAYDDEAAFNVHANGPYYKRFFDAVGEFAEEPKDRPSIKGARIEDTGEAVAGVLKVFRIDEACEQLFQTGEEQEFQPEHPENFIGQVRMRDLARQAGLPGVDVLAVFFDADARTKPHIHQTEQLLYFVHGNGFVAFPGQEEQVVNEGGMVVVPACELHMHGATNAGPCCHLAARLPSKTNWNPHVPVEWRQFAEDL